MRRLLIQSDKDTLQTSLWAHRAVKAVRDMKEVEYDRGKYTDPCVSAFRLKDHNTTVGYLE